MAESLRRSVCWAFAALLVGTLLTALTPGRAAAQSATPAPGGRPGRVALIGVPALMWRDVSPTSTPNLWRLAQHGSTGSLSVKAVGPRACPADGWLSVSAGVRSAYPGMPCVHLPPAPKADAHGDGATIPYFGQVAAANDAGDFQATIGTLAHATRAAGKCVTAIGPGAALGATDQRGHVRHYVPGIGRASAADWSRCPITLVNVDDVFQAHRQAAGSDGEPVEIPRAAREAAAARADAKVGRVLADLPLGTSVVVAGLSDHDRVPHLRVAMADDASQVAAATGHGAAGAGASDGGTLTSGSVRRSGMVILPDLTATLLRKAGIAVPGQVIGAPFEQSGTATGQRALADADVAAQTVRDLLPWFFAGLVTVQLLFYAIAALALRRGSARRRRRTLATVRIAALASAAIPLSTYLVNLVPWWSASHPLTALLVALPVVDALVVVLAAAGPWRRALLGPFTVVAVGTAATLGLDVMTGSNLQLNSLMGYTALVGGRYYGFGNIAFSVFVTSVILATAGLAQWISARGGKRSRTWAALTVLGLGCIGLALDGAPALGADFGGVIAFVPGLALTAMTVAGIRVSLVRLGGLCAVGGVLVMSIATADYLRPPAERTHLGRFVGQLVEGDAFPVVWRKLQAMLHTFGNMTLTPIMLAALVFLFFVLRRPDKARAGALDAAFVRAPMLRAGLIGALTTATVGTFVNDSGVAVIALALTLAVPLTLTAVIRALELDDAGPRPVRKNPRPDSGPAAGTAEPADPADDPDAAEEPDEREESGAAGVAPPHAR